MCVSVISTQPVHKHLIIRLSGVSGAAYNPYSISAPQPTTSASSTTSANWQHQSTTNPYVQSSAHGGAGLNNQLAAHHQQADNHQHQQLVHQMPQPQARAQPSMSHSVHHTNLQIPSQPQHNQPSHAQNRPVQQPHPHEQYPLSTTPNKRKEPDWNAPVPGPGSKMPRMEYQPQGPRGHQPGMMHRGEVTHIGPNMGRPPPPPPPPPPRGPMAPNMRPPGPGMPLLVRPSIPPPPPSGPPRGGGPWRR